MQNLSLVFIQGDDDKNPQQMKPPVDHTNEEEPQEGDEDYDEKVEDYKKRWQDKSGNTYHSINMHGALFWNYYVTYLSLITHYAIHLFLLGAWCSYSKLIMAYSFQVFLLHAYSWAIPDRRYAKWVKEMRPFFNFMSGLNIIFYLAGIFGGGYLYHNSKDGTVSTGLKAVALDILQTVVRAAVVVNGGRSDCLSEVMMTRAFPAALHATTNTDDNSVMQVPNCLVPPPLHEKKSALLIKISGKLKQISSSVIFRLEFFFATRPNKA